MAPRPSLRLPTLTPIPDKYKIPSTTRALVKSLSRLSRSSLIELALQWLRPEYQAACAPYLTSNRNLEEEAEEDYLYEPAESIETLRTTYESLMLEKGTKRDVIDRILDGDWRRGVSLQQLAMIDFKYLSDHESSLRWTALKLVPLNLVEKDGDLQPLKKKPSHSAKYHAPFPRIHQSTFLQALQHEISPLVKAHYFFGRLQSPQPLTVLRIYVADTPYVHPPATVQSYFTDAARSLYIALPDSCPYIYIALSGSGAGAGAGGSTSTALKMDAMALKRTVLEAVPKALSLPQVRYALETTALTARSLRAVCALRGSGRANAAGGAYSVFADASVDESPLEAVQMDYGTVLTAKKMESGDKQRSEQDTRPEPDVAGNPNRKRKALEETNANVQRRQDTRDVKTRKLAAATRFGTTGLSNAEHSAPIDRLQIRLDESLIVPSRDLFGQAQITSSTETETIDSVATAPRDETHSTHETSKTSSLLDISKLTGQNATKFAGAIDNPRPISTAAAAPSSLLSSNAPLSLTFHGTDIFSGLRHLAELGLLDLARIPAWMTGEEGVSNAAVRNGVVVGGWGGGSG